MGLTNRRTFLKSTLMSAAAIAGVAASGPGRVFAQAIAGPKTIDAPLVDKLTLRCVVDNRHDIFETTAAPAGVGVERFRLAIGEDVRKSLLSEWGLSLYMEAAAGEAERRYLLDFGLNAKTLINNLELLKIDPARLHGLMLSHGHMDHFGGLMGFLQHYGTNLSQGLKLYAGGEDVFCRRYFRLPDGREQLWGALDRREIKKAGVDLVVSEQASVVDGQLMTSGVVPRTSFEKVAPNTAVAFGAKDDLGCDASVASHFTQQELSGELYLDQHWHEHAACFNVKGKGLVVITSCGHGGLINNIQHLMEVTGVGKLHAVVGGFHLAPTKQSYVDQTVDALAALHPDVVIPMHCSGQNFVNAVAAKMPQQVVLNSTGSRYTFGA